MCLCFAIILPFNWDFRKQKIFDIIFGVPGSGRKKWFRNGEKRMRFWFGKKEEEPKSAPPAAAQPEPSRSEPTPAAVPVAASPAPAAAPAPAAPPPLPSNAPKERPVSPPLEPATTLIRPQPNQKVLYYQLMNGLYDAVLILDQNGHIVDCNSRVTPVLAYNRDEMWDMPVSDVIRGIGPQIFQQMKDALYNNHQVLINAKCTRKDGTTFQGEVGVCLMHLTRGENLVFTIRNVEKRMAEAMRKAREQLQGTAATPHPAPRAVLKAVSQPGQSPR